MLSLKVLSYIQSSTAHTVNIEIRECVKWSLTSGKKQLYRTAGHLVFWKPWPVTGHIATAKKKTWNLKPSSLIPRQVFVDSIFEWLLILLVTDSLISVSQNSPTFPTWLQDVEPKII